MASAQSSDPTFRSYSDEQAKTYAAYRRTYPQAVYDLIMKHHADTGGQFGLSLDCGCGPGKATRDIALSFDQAIGADPGEAMISTAKSLGGKTKSGSDVQYVISPAEEISHIDGLVPGSVDLLTAAAAVHWFDMEKFWQEAAKVLKPGGTVALWNLSSLFCHPSTPNASEVMKIIFRFQNDVVLPYSMPGNILSMNMYDDLPLPWDVSPAVVEFPKSQYVEHKFDRNGIPDNGVSFFGGGNKYTLAQLEKGMSTASMITRWRAANPELNGTDKDAVRVFVRELREAMGGQEWVERASATVILLFKKSA